MNKQHILGEIRRTASTNGGIPLGKSRLLSETGIRESDWSGKYWVGGDAVQEAGFRPNERQTAYADDILIEKFVRLMRELGRYPVHGERRLKARSDSEFPSHNTFARLGPK